MRVAVLADVHANLPALELVLDRLRAHDITRYVCAGDLVGYGPWPNQCVARLRDMEAICVAGNHDLMAVGRLPVQGAGRLAQRTLPWTQETLEPGTRAFLSELRTEARLSDAVVSHAALGDPTAYVRTTGQAAEQLDRLERDHPGARILVLGHTHHPFAFSRARGRLPTSADTVHLPPDEPVLLNPGSVGQPREREPMARFMILDVDRRTAAFEHVRFDLRACRRELRRRGLPVVSCHRRPSRIRSARASVLRRTPAGRLLDRRRSGSTRR